MGKRDKFIAKIQQSPTPKDITWDKVESLLKHFGAEIDKSSGGSHANITLNGVTTTMVMKSPMKPYLVKQVVELLKDAGVI